MKLRSRDQALKRFLLTLSLFTVALFFLFRLVDEAMVEKKRALHIDGDSLELENLFSTEDDILRDRSLFFLDTTRMRHPNKERNLTMRQICSIESAALANPQARVFIILVSPEVLTTSIKLTPELRDVLNVYPNVYVKAMHLVQYTIDTPIESFIANGSIYDSRFIRAHTADVLRLLLLWKFGGTYLDTDMIVRQQLDSVPGNFICRDHGYLNNAIINLSGAVGKRLAEIFIRNTLENFNPKEWSENGPFMLARVLLQLCGTSRVQDMHVCEGFQVLDDNLCYPIRGTTWENLFDEKIGREVYEMMNDSMVVHFWNKLSHKEKLRCDSNAAYTRLAREFCPRTMENCHEFFEGWK